jgi:pimeloyl-ACP methyl ester carboxylesterase
MMTERTIRIDGVELATQAFGDPARPAVLLIMGAMASMLWWPQEFCERLAGHGRHVIRYDNRDTGLSTKYPPGAAPYSGDDMADDAVRVLDGHGIAAAHLVGMSMGGALAQRAALRHPSRVLSLTVISSSPVGIDTSRLPGPSAAYREHAAAGAGVDWSDRAEAIESMVAESRVIAGTAHPFDEARVRRLVERDFDRAGGYASATNHFNLKDSGERRAGIDALKAPLLVIHGTADPMFPIEHGIALSKAVKGARLVRIEGGGHELNSADWDTIVGAVVGHTRIARA